MMSGCPEVLSHVATSASKIPPVVVILGATGTGKSKLAVSLAQHFRGEVISADSMQVYKDLDILTNKVTDEEMKGIPHHMISIVEPNQHFDVIHFRNQALPIVERTLAEGRIPFIVGGTNYYIESLLWKVLLDKSNETRSGPFNRDSVHDIKKRKLDSSQPSISASEHENILQMFETNCGQVEEEELSHLSSVKLHSALQQVDAERSTKLHPNDRRKIIRSLQVRFQTGKKHSEILFEQSAKNNNSLDEGANSHLGGPLRFSNCFCFWIQADKEILIERINARVHDMVDRGLRRELENYITKLRSANSNLDFTRGLLQSIGFKEFNAYIQLEPEDWYTDVGNKLFEDGIELLKIATRQYASKQIKWVNQRFLRPGRREVPPVYWLDGTLADSDSWQKNVNVPALSILESHLSGNLENQLLVDRLVPPREHDDDLVVRVCEACERSFLGLHQWKSHINGNKHQKFLKRRRLKKLKEDALSLIEGSSGEKGNVSK